MDMDKDTSTQTVCVTPREDRWQVTVDQRRRGRLFRSRESALEAARVVAHRLGVDLVVRGNDGRVEYRERTFLHLRGLQ